MRERVFVGMSGGVDSSVAALRLLNRGYAVVGVFIKVWQPDFIHCDWEKERLDAMRVAAHLGIPFLTMDAEDAYKKHVADYMISSYTMGITPNPDVMCNEHVKFGAFYEWARNHGADAVATGHYAQVLHGEGKARLMRSVDAHKDQTYFLWRMHQEALEHTLFPIGDSLKADVRAEAVRAGIPTATKSDSQGICFLGQVDMYTFLSHFIRLTPGAVLTPSGTVIGTHRGALLYTEGQRHGFTVTSKTHETPHYVVARDIDANTITVDTVPRSPIGAAVTLTDLHELGNGFEDALLAVPRYHARPESVTLTRSHTDRATLKRANAADQVWVRGQSCVLYRGDECVGGGVIS